MRQDAWSFTDDELGKIKAINTLYKGYNFRSRLEARWAIFMDVLGIKWEYEPEGYRLPAGDYLPDFLLVDIDCFAEVKPKLFTVAQRAKCLQLPKPCLLLDAGHPTAKPYFVAGKSDELSGPYGPDCGDGYGWAVLSASHHKGRLWFIFGENYTRDYLSDEIAAENAAKSARFEHGERVTA